MDEQRKIRIVQQQDAIAVCNGNLFGSLRIEGRPDLRIKLSIHHKS